jgi:hypothetical protein
VAYVIRRRWNHPVYRLGLVRKAINHLVQACCGCGVSRAEKHYAAPLKRGGGLPDEVDAGLKLRLGEHRRKSPVAEIPQDPALRWSKNNQVAILIDLPAYRVNRIMFAPVAMCG